MSVDLKIHTFIRASRADVWAALTDAASVAAFHPTAMQVKPLETGGYALHRPDDGSLFIREPVLSQVEGERLELGFEPAWVETPEGSTVIVELSDDPLGTKVTLSQTRCADLGIGDNRDRFLASMKSWLETGEGLHRAATEAA
ncbi:SRPBCC domain-containing protein [uncultured Marivita sp.]|uniref:SRPBCC family protein n=1 Tax=uncultured Marivita sp. TaxID=888080 RepID=UPI0026371318|nr:SRPBCC domain-containing protein [uncultured Marivita sp.]